MNPLPTSFPDTGDTMSGTEHPDRIAKAKLRTGGETWFLADWCDLVFIHYEVEAAALQAEVPLPLDLSQGRAFISLVAFTMRRMRCRRGGALTAWLTSPIATQRLLNLRTYVVGKDGPGIFFLREWIDHPLAVWLGPPTFGLPYRRARLDYEISGAEVAAKVRCGRAEGSIAGECQGDRHLAAAGSEEAFLVERYVAYTAAGPVPRFFRVWHRPWELRSLTLTENTLPAFLTTVGYAWAEAARFHSAGSSEGVRDVWMGRPHRA